MSPMAFQLLLCAVVLATALCTASAQNSGYNYPKPTTTTPTSGPFTGYNYPKPSKPFNEGYSYTTPKCPLVLPSTSTLISTSTIVSTTVRTETLPPITQTQTQTETRTETAYITLPPIVQIETSSVFVTLTSTEIQPTTVTSLLTTTYCQPNSYLPPPPPTPPPNTYLPVEPPSKEYLPAAGGGQPNDAIIRTSVSQVQTGEQGNGAGAGTFISSSFVQQQQQQQQQTGPIKRAAGSSRGKLRDSWERTELNEVLEAGQPAINIIYLDRQSGGAVAGATTAKGQPSAALVSWLLCKFNLSTGSCNGDATN
ncbi:gibberellin-regulated protein 14-like [Anopheles albimanus]|nr:gibberellin-regulated protein 14-like [Anopheles albimanus]